MHGLGAVLLGIVVTDMAIGLIVGLLVLELRADAGAAAAVLLAACLRSLLNGARMGVGPPCGMLPPCYIRR
jgi:hypothetical protein